MNKLNQLYKWIANDGLLHILICIVLMLSLQPIVDYLLALIFTCLCSIGKEYFDYYIQKDNSKKQVGHDFICNIIGIIVSTIIIILWKIL